MPQTRLPFQYQGSSRDNFTSCAGLPLFLEMARVCGLSKAFEEEMQIKAQGWSDSQIIQSLLLLNMAGGTSVEDIAKLELDRGLNRLLIEMATHGMRRQDRRLYQRRFRKGQGRAFPSPSAIRRYLEAFHAQGEEIKRVKGTAFIPEKTEALSRLVQSNQSMIDFAQAHQPCETATLDMDATLAETTKRNALYC